ncbi:hypothetical protein EDD15DRAFT_2277618 [Pisolithus albus]|nr:hypothetical protein EDD15DRAFT_2277618 [Pisolithus albus]
MLRHFTSVAAQSARTTTIGTEWETYAESKQITYRVALSRDGPEETKRTYVQDLILQDKDSFWDLLNDQRGTLIISGSSNKMPAAVRGSHFEHRRRLREDAERGRPEVC